MSKVLQNDPFVAFINTLDLHKAIMGLVNHFFGLFESGRFTQVLLHNYYHRQVSASFIYLSVDLMTSVSND